MLYLLLVVSSALSFEIKEGLSAKYEGQTVKVIYRNETKTKQKIALLKRGLPILDIEESGWFSWKRIYPEGKALRLKSGEDVIRPGKVKVYRIPIKLDRKKSYRLDIHGFGGTPIEIR